MRLSFLCFFLVSSLVFITSQSSNDLDALLSLKLAMVGHNHSVAFQDWTQTSSSPFPHCTFSGVTCDDNFKVVALNLSFCALNSSIPPEIGQLVNLVNLTIAGSNITGQLPLEISKLTSLKLLNLSNNVIEGDFPGQITLGMTQLEVLDVYNNNFKGSLPRELVKLKRLKHLHLGGNYFGGLIPESYSELENLEYLGLNGNALSGRVPPSLSKLKKLKEMYIGYYNMYDGGIPQEFSLLDSLQILDMANCNIAGEIPPSFGQLKHLHTLFLQMNRLTGNIPGELSGLVSLMSLDLSINELTGEIPGSFSELQNLTLLNLFRNKLGGQIPEFIGDLPNLEVLQVWGNNFTFGLPQNLGQNGRLYKLDVSYNHLTGLIPPNLCKGDMLVMLILMNNFFIGPLPAELGQCKSLDRIRIASNMLTGTIPAGIFNLPKVTVVELDDNLFSGELPGEISEDALLLEWLTVSNNRIEGAIPAAIGNLKNLQTLRLDNNRFSGELPEELFNLQQLSKVNVSANNISGEIPSSLRRCISLTILDLSQNSLSGELPQQISELKVLSLLNVSRNLITGRIPSDMRTMASLTVLDLSYNDLVGKVPSGGQFYVFKDSAFAGNPKLCTPHHTYCPSVDDSSHGFGHGHMGPLSVSKLIVTIIAFVTGLLLISVTFYMIRKKRLRNSRTWKLTAFQRLDFKAEDVLECLKDENFIGKGGAGIVYRGSMPDGVDVAIKRLVGRGSGRSDHGFTAEIQTLGRIRHRNIVRLLGYVSNKDTNLLLYEYMPNGSLGEMLHGSKGGHLQWEARFRIAVEAAKGLSYLHHDCSPLIIHRDVKSNNILLDSDFEAHVADFGLAKFLQDPGASECMSSVAGSYGYIAPEYAYTLKVDEKSDVYSFGVVLLELIAGRKPVGEFGDGVDIVRWVRKTTSELSQPSDAASVLAVVDSRLSGYPLTGVTHLFKIAMMCVEDESSSRPTMRQVVHMLTNPHSPPTLLTLN